MSVYLEFIGTASFVVCNKFIDGKTGSLPLLNVVAKGNDFSRIDRSASLIMGGGGDACPI